MNPLQKSSALRMLMRPEKHFFIGLLACTFAMNAMADSSARPTPPPAEAVKNRQGMAHFKQGHYNLKPKGRTAEAREQMALAEKAFKEAIEINGDCADAHRNLAHLYFVQQRFSEAASEYAHVIRLDPNDIDTYVHMALAQIEMGNLDEAVRYLENARDQTNDERVLRQLDSYIEKIRQAE